jgi:hypothetical protein
MLNFVFGFAVLDFLGSIPLLQQLPGASVQKIADVVKLRHFGERPKSFFLPPLFLCATGSLSCRIIPFSSCELGFILH